MALFSANDVDLSLSDRSFVDAFADVEQRVSRPMLREITIICRILGMAYQRMNERSKATTVATADYVRRDYPLLQD